MATHIINGVKIHTNFDYPPIPVRDCDWSAVTDNYEAESDSEGSWSSHPVGRGATELEAISELFDQLEDQTNDGDAVSSVNVDEIMRAFDSAIEAIKRA